MTASSSRFVLTNRMNLNGMLSSRVIGPRQSFGKYYQDLLQLTDGYIPFLSSPPAEDCIDYVSAKAPTGPALLELADPPPYHDNTVVQLAHAIPFSQVTAIHLPDDRALREHLARRY